MVIDKNNISYVYTNKIKINYIIVTDILCIKKVTLTKVAKIVNQIT